MEDQDFTVKCHNCHSTVLASKVRAPEKITYDNFVCPACGSESIPVEDVWMGESHGDVT